MSRILSIFAFPAVLSLLACEGEPPKVPVNPPATAGTPVSTEPAAPGSAAPAAPAAPASDCAPAPCPCHCGANGQAVPVAPGPPAPAATPPPALPGPAPSAAPAPQGALVAPAPASELASIVGKVTTTPARAAASAVIYLEDAPIVAGPAMSASMDNHGMAFSPFVQVVPAGGRIVFFNTDPFPHNVFSPGKTGFNLGMLQSKATSAHVFASPGVFPLLCNLHPNMLAYIVVTPSSYFAKANAKGEFTIKNVPAGSYKLTAWAPREQPQTQAIVVQSSQVNASFDLHK